MEKTIGKRPAGEPIRVIYETANYRVFIGLLSAPADQDEAMRLKFIIQDKKFGVIYGVTGHRTAAFVAAEEAEQALEQGAAILDEMAIRKATPPGNSNGKPS